MSYSREHGQPFQTFHVLERMAPELGIRGLSTTMRDSIGWARWLPIGFGYGERDGGQVGLDVIAGNKDGKVRVRYMPGIVSRRQVLQPPQLYVRGNIRGEKGVDVYSPARIEQSLVVGQSIKFAGKIPVHGTVFKELWVQPSLHARGHYIFRLSEKATGVPVPARSGRRKIGFYAVTFAPPAAHLIEEPEPLWEDEIDLW